MFKKGLMFFAVGVCLFLLALTYFAVSLASVPYDIPAEKVTVEYLSSITALGKYKLVDDLPSVPVEQEDGSFVSFFTKDAKSKVDGSETIVAIGNDTSRITDMLASLESAECEARSSQQSNTNGTQYYKGNCDSFNYYIYQIEGENWISFSTPDGKAVLSEVINAYLESK